MPEKRLEKTRRVYQEDLVFRSVDEMEAYYTQRDREAQAERIRALLARGAADAVAKQRQTK